MLLQLETNSGIEWIFTHPVVLSRLRAWKQAETVRICFEDGKA